VWLSIDNKQNGVDKGYWDGEQVWGESMGVDCINRCLPKPQMKPLGLTAPAHDQEWRRTSGADKRAGEAAGKVVVKHEKVRCGVSSVLLSPLDHTLLLTTLLLCFLLAYAFTLELNTTTHPTSRGSNTSTQALYYHS
jgi:hypothetical protein